MRTRVLPEYQELQELLNNFSYRPDWEFFIEESRLRIRARVQDADSHGKLIPLQSAIQLPPYNALARGWDWIRWLRNELIKIETHELDEFFQINGVKVFDPHKGEVL